MIRNEGCYNCLEADWDADGCTCKLSGMKIGKPSTTCSYQRQKDFKLVIEVNKDVDLIDREALLKSLYEDCHCMNSRFLDCVRFAPRVNPIKRGFWKAQTESDISGFDPTLTGGYDPVALYICSVCGEDNILDENGDRFLPPYCPFCGAYLKEDVENA